MIDIDNIILIMHKLMFAKPHQLSNDEDAYIEYEIRLSKEERDDVYSCLNTLIHLLNSKCNIFDEHRYATKETGINKCINEMLNKRY